MSNGVDLGECTFSLNFDLLLVRLGLFDFLLFYPLKVLGM
jgi:hypothetical protein